MASTSAIVSQLRALEHLTRTEAAIARARVAQARTDAVRKELTDNADAADRRGADVAAALRSLRAAPDIVAPAIGWVAALVKSTLEQSRPLDEALLGDLALEHMLADRARYLLVLSQADHPSVHRLAQRLLDAHTETIEWLQAVLAEEALGGPAALRPTPLQVVAVNVIRTAGLPARLAFAGVNRAAEQLTRAGRRTRQEATETGQRIERLAEDAREVVVTGVDAAAQRAEQVARRDDAPAAAEAVHAARRDAGALDSDELPIRDYAGKPAKDAAAAVRELRDAESLAAVQNYEERHRNRAGVLTAVRERTAELAREAAAL